MAPSQLSYLPAYLHVNLSRCTSTMPQVELQRRMFQEFERRERQRKVKMTAGTLSAHHASMLFSGCNLCAPCAVSTINTSQHQLLCPRTSSAARWTLAVAPPSTSHPQLRMTLLIKPRRAAWMSSIEVIHSVRCAHCIAGARAV